MNSLSIAAPVATKPAPEPEAGSCPLCRKKGAAELLADSRRRLMRCPSCGVAYLNPWPPRQEVAAYFSNSYINTTDDIEIRFGTKQKESLQRVARFIHRQKKSGRILDIGCAGGHFLDWFFPKADWECWGVELSHMAWEAAKKKQIHMHIGDIHSGNLPTQSFDVITVLDTFYYFSDPRRELQRIRELLKPDGLLVMVLVSSAGHIWRHSGWVGKFLGEGKASVLRSSHLMFYDPRSIAYVLQDSSFQVNAIKPWPATGQQQWWRGALFRGYFELTSLLWFGSASRIMMAPRFLAAATPQSALPARPEKHPPLPVPS